MPQGGWKVDTSEETMSGEGAGMPTESALPPFLGAQTSWL